MKKYTIAAILILSCVFAKAQTTTLPPLSARDIRSSTDTIIYNAVDASGEFPGGMEKFMDYLVKTIRYPENARKQNIQGKVFLQFIVEKDGALSHIKVVRGISPDLDAEAVRVMKASPLWRPATLNGVIVRNRFTVPISFALAK